MSFVARHLSVQEAAILNLGSQGIPQSRIPNGRKWPFAIDEQRNALCTQLISTTGEMLDDRYYYLLFWRGIASVYCRECGRLNSSQAIVSSKRTFSEESETLQMAKEAIAALDSFNRSSPIVLAM